MAATPPCGLWLSASLARVDRPPAIDLTGDGAPSRMSRRVPAHIAAGPRPASRTAGRRPWRPRRRGPDRRRRCRPGTPGQRAEVPRRQAGAGDPARRLGQHRPQPRPSSRCELGDVLALGQDAAGVGHPEGDPQVPRQLGQIPGVARHAHPAQRPQLAADGVGRSPDGSPRRATTSRATSGAGTRSRRSALGSDRISAVTSSSRSPGTCQSNPAAVDLVEHGERDVDGHAVGSRARLELVGQRQRQLARRPGQSSGSRRR